MKDKVIAIVGMCGSGKSVAADILVNLGYKRIYFGGVVLDQLEKEHLEINPENEKMMREKLRKQYGMSACAQILLPKIREYAYSGKTVLDGLYSWEELKFLKTEFKENLIVIAIVLDKKLRYNRLSTREIRPFNKEEAEKRDITEIENLAKGGPIAFADYYIDNNKTIEGFKKRLLSILEEVK